ncbi:MAG: DUF2169 domain-containing protein [Candidatus Thiodiazotropha sp.]|jgi:hypothetical protein
MINQTQLPAHLHPHTDTAGRRLILVISKATWHIHSGRLAPAEKQIGIFKQPQRHCLGDFDLDAAQRAALGRREQEKVIWLDHDLAPPKPRFDLMVAGYVTPPEEHSELKIVAAVLIESRQLQVEAHVPHFWVCGLPRHTVEPLGKRLHRTPMSYAFADWPGGFPLEAEPNHPQQLPWLRRPGAACRRKRHDMHPVGFGYWPESASHRQCHSGTYDEPWARDRKPRPPKDFDERFFNAAHPDLQWSQAPVPGTQIRLIHLAETPALILRMPALELAAQATTADGIQLPSAMLKPDTLTIEPDQQRMSLIQRTVLPKGQGAQALSSIRLYRLRGLAS